MSGDHVSLVGEREKRHLLTFLRLSLTHFSGPLHQKPQHHLRKGDIWGMQNSYLS